MHEIKHEGYRLIIRRQDVSVDRQIPRGKFIGERVDGPPARVAEYFFKSEACGGWSDLRDLGSVLGHDGPLPHPAGDKPQ
jgi:hypothetical protein